MHTPLNTDNIKRLIDNEIDLANQLQALLQKEHDALSHRYFSELPNIIEQKVALVESLDNASRMRIQISEANSDDARHWQKLLENDKTLHASFEVLQQEINLCQRVNRINELVVNRSLKATQRVLGILRGSSLEQNLYSKAGDKVKAKAIGSYVSA
jgi:flagellar biosynthesis/type III secretory pathway chaperone